MNTIKFKLLRRIRAERIKQKHTFLPWFHLGLPVLGAAVFLLYYKVSYWKSYDQLGTFVQIIGISLPVAAGIVCAGSVELEEEGHFQTFLGTARKKETAFLAKWIFLQGMAFLAVVGAMVLYGAGAKWFLGDPRQTFTLCIWEGFWLWLGSIPLYLIHLFLNLQFSRNVSLAVSVVEFLIAALFLTGLGDGVWQFAPCSWSSRGAMLALNLLLRGTQDEVFIHYAEQTGTTCVLIGLLLCGIIMLWFRHYEGRQEND